MYQLLVRARQLDILLVGVGTVTVEYRANYYSSHERTRVEFVLHCTHNKLVALGLQSSTKRTDNGESSNRQWWKQQAYERRLTGTRIQQNR